MGMRRIGLVFGVWVFLLSVAVFGVVFDVPLVSGSGTIHIRADGSIDPPDAPISSVDNVTYAFTDDINDSIVVERNNITIDGAGYTLQGDGSGNGFTLSGVNNVTIRRSNIEGFRYGIYASWGHITISENNIMNNTDAGMNLDGSSYNTVYGNNITNNGYKPSCSPSCSGYGISLERSSYNTIYDNNLTRNGRDASYSGFGIHLYESFNNIISGNEITKNGYGASLYGYGVGFSWSSYNTICGNNITDNERGIALGFSSSSNTVAGNNFINNTKQAYVLSDSLNNIWNYGYPSGGNCWSNYNGTDFYGGPYQNETGNDGIGDAPYIIDAYNQDNYPLINPLKLLPIHNINTGLDYVTIQEAINADETLDGHTVKVEPGIYFEHVSIYKSLTLVGESTSTTIIDGNGTGNVVTVSVSHVNISKFTIKHSEVYGLQFFHSSNNTISGNYITNNPAGGLWFGATIGDPSSHNNIISKNYITNNGMGLWFQNDAENNLISGNNIARNLYGIGFNSSPNNKIYHNNFVNNSYGQVYGYANTWDDDYPSGGNYWSDYNGTDLYSGHNQSEMGSDGIGDTPYHIGDHYPLVNPMGSPQPPIALFAYTPENPAKDQTATFNATSSHDRDGNITTYKWDFGDGNITTTTDPVIKHVYTASGTYTMGLTVADNDGLNHSTTKSITVTEDLIAPTTIHDYDGLWHTIDFTINLTATDDMSGVAETYYRINDGPIQNVSINGQPLTTTESVNNTLEYWSIDNSDNEELPHKILIGIKLDKTCPTIETPSRTPEGDISPDQSVEVSANVTDAVSGIENVTLSYTINNGVTWTGLRMNYSSSTKLYNATIPQQQAGTIVEFKIVAYDNAGNNATLDGAEPYCVYEVIPEFPSAIITPLLMLATLLAIIIHKRKHERVQRRI